MITKIHAFNAERNFHPLKPQGPGPACPSLNKELTKQISFMGNNEHITTESTAANKNTQNLPSDVALAYASAQNMLQNISNTAKDAVQTGIEAQCAAREAKEKVKALFAAHKGKVPAQVSIENEDGSEDIAFFTNGALSTYRKNVRKFGEKTQIDKLLVFNNGKLISYKEGITTSNNKGSARKDIIIEKSLEYNKISTIYKEGFKSIAGSPIQTKKIMCLIFGKPWYLEEGITEKRKEKPGEIKRRLEFSNKEKTTYSYQENIKIYDDTRISKKALYVENDAPYRYSEEERFSKSAFNMFNLYGNKKLLTLVDGKWHIETTY